MKLKTGQYVRHLKYGWGSVVECDRVQTEVYFQSVGIKKFATSLSNFITVQASLPQKKTAP
ncbi:MAG: hypothetical protein ACRD19_12300 [Terriglobia bacterium]